MTMKTQLKTSWDAEKAVLRGKLITNNTILPQETKKHRIDNLTLHLKQLYKEEHTHTQNKISKRQEIINIRTELSEKEMKEAISSGQSLSRVQLFATP